MAKLFKGYFLSVGKKPLYSVKNDIDEILKEKPINHDFVGLLYEDVVQVDFDTEVTANKALEVVKAYKLQCDILKTTRGIHLYFKTDARITKQSVGVYNAMGIPCDIGLGIKDRVVPLRITEEVEIIRIINGKEVASTTKRVTEREWLQTYDTLEVIPPYFLPIGGKDYNLAKSNTRNQTLFSYILKLQVSDFSKEEIRKTIKIINKHILYEPLDDKEIDIITRDESFSEELFFVDGRFLHDRFGNYMLTNSNIIMIDGKAHIYTNENLYSNDTEEFEKRMIDKIPSLKDSQRKEVYKYISLRCKNKGVFAEPRYIGLKNTILDIETMEQFPYSPKWVINNKIEYDYDETSYSELMDKTLNKVSNNDIEIRTLIEEMIGYVLYRKNTMQSCFILTGEGSNGKSTILNVIKKLIGKGNYCSLDLKELEDTFKPAQLYNKLANIGDDISSKYLESSSIFKKVVTGESLVVQRKYEQPFELESYATQIFCANELPPVHDKSDGFSRRIVIIPFMARFTRLDIDYDPFIESKLLLDINMGYVLKLAIEGLRRLLMNTGFTKSHKSEREKSEYVKSNNNVLDWLDDEPKIQHEVVGEIYRQYAIWCSTNGNTPYKRNNFGKELKKSKGLVSTPRSINGKTVRIYEREEEDENK